MTNMSYCRFQNTLNDLRDCHENMDEDGLSFDEAASRLRLIKICVEIAANYGDEIGAACDIQTDHKAFRRALERARDETSFPGQR